jgi:hypothetical protein
MSGWPFPVDGVHSCVDGQQWGEIDDVFASLRHFALKSNVTVLDQQVEHADVVAVFLLGIRERQRQKRSRVVETAKALMRSKLWEQEIQKHPLLLQVSSPITKSVADDSAQQPNTLCVDVAKQQTDIDAAKQQPTEATRAPTAADFAPWGRSEESHDSSEAAPQSFPPPLHDDQSATTYIAGPPCDTVVGPPSAESLPPVVTTIISSTLPPSVAEGVHQGIEAVLSIDNILQRENWSISAFAQLRQAILRAAQLPADELQEILDEEVEYSSDVLFFLIDIAKNHPIRKQHVCEVLNILMANSSWLKNVDGSVLRKHMDGVPHGVPPEVRAIVERHLGSRRKRDRLAKKLKGFFMCGRIL